jgi:Family of unknown function (DUF5684)
MNTLTPVLAGITEQEIAVFLMIAVRLLIVFFIGYFLISIVPVAIGMWKVFTKSGQPGWAVLIPVYNLILLLRIAGLPWYWVFTPLIVIIPILGWIVYLAWVVWVHHRISTRFGKGIGFTIGLTLLAPIFWLILGLGDSKYVGEQPAQA